MASPSNPRPTMHSTNFAARLRLRLFLFCALALLGMSLLVALVVITSMSGYWKDMEAISLQEATSSKARDVTEWARRQRLLARKIALHGVLYNHLESLRLGYVSREELVPLVQESVRRFLTYAPQALTMMHMDHEGRPLSPLSIPREVLNAVDFSKDSVDFSLPFMFEGHFAVMLINPVKTPQGLRLGTDLLVVSLSYLQKALGQKNVVLAYADRGTARYFWPPEHCPEDAVLLPTAAKALAGDKGRVVADKHALGYMPVPETPWALVLVNESESAYSAATRNVRFLVHLLLAYLGCVGGFWLLSRPLAGAILVHTRDLEVTNHRLEQAQARSRELAGRLIHLLEDTRMEISRDIHDHLGQLLTTLRLSVENLRDEYTAGNPQAQGRFDEAASTVQDIQRAVKDIATGLRPPCLHYAGLVPTLEGLMEEFRASSGLDIHFFHNDVPARLSDDLALALYRMAQEALNNAVRHAGPCRVHLSLTRCGDVMALSVEDDGQGFDMAALQNKRSHNNGRYGGRRRNEAGGGHLGLVLMRERAMLLGGELFIESAPGRGTHVIVELPCTEEA